MKKKILITTTGACLAKELISSKLNSEFEYIFTNEIVTDKDKLKLLLSDASAVIIGSEFLDREILHLSNQLRIIVRLGGGISNIDVEYAASKNIKIYEIKCENVSRDTALLSLGLFCSYIFNFQKHFSDSKFSKWDRIANKETDQILGIVGSGRVALYLAKSLGSMGFKIVYWSRSSKKEFDKIGCYYINNLAKLIKESKAIFIALALVDDTKNFIDMRFLRDMKGKILINTSRGGIVNEKDVLYSLDNKFLEAYLTDVTEKEPPADISLKLRSHKKVLTTPHIGGYSINNLCFVLQTAMDIIYKHFKIN